MAAVRARRIVAVSPDGAFASQLAAALEGAGGAVEVYPTLDALWAVDAEEAALCVLHVEGELACPPGELLPRVPGACPVIAVLPRPDLAAAVELMQAAERVAGVLAAEGGGAGRAAALAARILADDPFGLAAMVAPGTAIHEELVGNHREKARCMAQIEALAEQAGVPSRYRAPLEQCIDEMLMNALYDAPVGARGERLFAGVPARVRITKRTEQHAVVRYACDGARFAVAVRDAFGSLERGTVLRHLLKGLHAVHKVDRRAGGAGLGLYLMASSVAALSLHVLPGIATEAVCVLDLAAPQQRLEELAFLVQRDARGQSRTGPARVLPAEPRRRARAIAAALAGTAAIAAVLGLVVLPRLRGGEPGAGSGMQDASPPRPVATVQIDSEPAGAAVEIDGAPLGSTPLTVTSLVPGATVTVTFKRSGYRTTTAHLQVPAAGASKHLLQELALSADFVRVRFVSRPPGAEVLESGRASTTDRTFTPAELFVEAGKEQRFTLVMPRHVPLVIEPFTPERGAEGLEKGGDLAPGATLRVEATRAGKVSVQRAPHCRELALPAECVLAPGSHVVEYIGPDDERMTRTVMMTSRDMTITIP